MRCPSSLLGWLSGLAVADRPIVFCRINSSFSGGSALSPVGEVALARGIRAWGAMARAACRLPPANSRDVGVARFAFALVRGDARWALVGTLDLLRETHAIQEALVPLARSAKASSCWTLAFSCASRPETCARPGSLTPGAHLNVGSGRMTSCSGRMTDGVIADARQGQGRRPESGVMGGMRCTGGAGWRQYMGGGLISEDVECSYAIQLSMSPRAQ